MSFLTLSLCDCHPRIPVSVRSEARLCGRTASRFSPTSRADGEAVALSTIALLLWKDEGGFNRRKLPGGKVRALCGWWSLLAAASAFETLGPVHAFATGDLARKINASRSELCKRRSCIGLRGKEPGFQTKVE